MDRLSTAGFVLPSVYIRFPLFVLAKGRSRQLSTIPKKARGTVGFWATRPVLPGPAAPRCPAVRSADPNRTWYVRVLYSTSSVKQLWTVIRNLFKAKHKNKSPNQKPPKMFAGRIGRLQSRASRFCKENMPKCQQNGPHRQQIVFFARSHKNNQTIWSSFFGGSF